jgi:uncharacterized protein (DUF305 family)
MTSRHYQAAAAGVAVIAALTLAACGTSASTGAPVSPASSAAVSAPATPTAFSTADSTFTTRMLGLEGQSAAMAAAVTGHTATPEIQQFAARMRTQVGDAQRMRELMGSWHQPVPAPYSPGASLPAAMMGAGMMNAADWAEMSNEHGQSFSSHWLDAMISGYNAEVALCRQELGSGTSPQARALARTMLSERQSELAQLQQWHQDPQMGMMG